MRKGRLLPLINPLRPCRRFRRRRVEDTVTAGFFETAQEFLLVEGPGGAIRRVNMWLAELLGRPAESLVGRRVSDLFEGKQAWVEDDSRGEDQGGGPVQWECRCRDAEGAAVTLHWSISRHRATGNRYWVGWNITERKRLEAQLAGQARAINASQAVIEFSLDGIILAANDRFLRLMEYSATDLIGHHHQLLVEPSYVETEEYRLFWQQLNKGEFQAGQFRRLTRGGHTIWLQATYTPVLDVDGKPERIIKFATDITGRVAAERQLHTLNASLSKNLELARQRDADNLLISEITVYLQASETEEEVLEIVRRYLPRLSGRAQAAVYLLGPEGDHGDCQATTGESGLFHGSIGRTDCWGLRRGACHARATGDAAPVCKHFCAPAPAAPDPATFCIPIFADGPAGLITAVWTEPASSDGHDDEFTRTRAVLQTAAGRIGSTLEAIRLRSRLQEESVRDGLTGLYNRRCLDERLPRELLQAQRSRMPVSLLMIDLDRFKSLNDTLGHEAGDRALQAVARVISGQVRKSDLVCRYGGEEFVVVLPGETKEEAARKAESIRQAVAQTEIPAAQGQPIRVTVSAGVGEAVSLDAGAVLRSADRALYDAKASGRNTVRVYSHHGEIPAGNNDRCQSLSTLNVVLSEPH